MQQEKKIINISIEPSSQDIWPTRHRVNLTYNDQTTMKIGMNGTKLANVLAKKFDNIKLSGPFFWKFTLEAVIPGNDGSRIHRETLSMNEVLTLFNENDYIKALTQEPALLIQKPYHPDQEEMDCSFMPIWSSFRPIQSIGEILEQKFGIDVHTCDVVELTLLALAGVEEKPAGQCLFDDGDSIIEKDKLEKNHSQTNSVFFQFSLSNSESMTRLQEFAQVNGMEFHDYTHTLSETDKESHIKLIRIDAKSANETLFPMILDYLHQNPDIVNTYPRKPYEKSANETPKATNNGMKDPESKGSYSWSRFFSNHGAVVATACTITALAIAAKALGNRG